MVERRARLVKMMKTVRSLQLAANSPEVGVLVERLAEQLIELMPELVNVDSWPIVGKRRTNELAPVEERMVMDLGLEGSWTSDRAGMTKDASPDTWGDAYFEERLGNGHL